MLWGALAEWKVSKCYYEMVEPLPIMYTTRVYEHTLPNLTYLGEVEKLERSTNRPFSYVNHRRDSDIT
jgi:hypothetical protein